MTRRIREPRTVLSLAVVVVGLWLAVGRATAAPGVAATLLLATGTRRFDGVTGLAGSLAVGAVLGGVVGVAVSAATVYTRVLAVGLGVALGGGIGAVAGYAFAGTESQFEDETVTVEMDDVARSPQPADLFDGHPDPILYVTDEGHGPVVRAANAAFETTFDVPGEALTDAPLAEALFVDDPESVLADLEGTRDVRVTCETPDGERPFRVRSTGIDADGYVLFTPA